jgi:hypothetical protein
MTARRLKNESGFAMVSVMVLMLVGTLFAIAAFSSSKADTGPSSRDRLTKQAYAAAEAGLNYYLFRLGQDNSYWKDCDQVLPPSTTEPNPVNLEGSPALRWRAVPGTSSSYAIELLAQNGVNPSGNWCDTNNANASVLDAMSGTLQVRSTGRSGGVRRSVVTTLRRSGFLDYLYFTDFETQDPQVTGSGATCDIYRRAGRTSPPCSNITFANNDVVNGPFHTNDDILVCGSPTFGRTSADAIEVSGPSPGYTGCAGSTPNFVGTFKYDAKLLSLPSSNASLASLAQPGYLFTGTTQITLGATTMTVTNGGSTNSGVPLPPNGVIYVQNGTCGATYSAPQTYTEPSGCANVYVKGSTSKSLTIASARDIIVTDSLIRTGNNMIGLIADGFVRVYHPVSGSCTDTASGPFGPSIGSIEIDAAILSLQHAFIVDNYNCGSARGTLTVKGAIAQKFRGPVGTGGSSISTGYVKNYNYDDRFRVANPPYFLDPVQSQWRKIRFTEQSPARQGP